MAVMDDRTRDGLADYGFSIEFQPNHDGRHTWTVKRRICRHNEINYPVRHFCEPPTCDDVNFRGYVVPLRLLWLVAIISAVSLLPMALTGAAASEAAVACPTSVDVPSKASPRFYPPHVAGDREFSGHGPAITVSAKRETWDATPDFLRVVVKMRAEETQPDWTKAEGTQQTFTLYTAPTGCRIDSVQYGAFDSNGYLARASHSNPYTLGPGDTGLNPSFVLEYTVWDNRSGPDVNDYTSVRITTRPFKVRLTN